MSILILDDDPDVAVAAKLLLQRRCGPVRVLHQPDLLLAALIAEPTELLLLDMNFSPGCIDGAQGLALLKQVLLMPKPPAVIVMTAYAEVDLAVQALKAGAFDFVTKPWDNAKLVATVTAALANRGGQSGPCTVASNLLGDSPAMQALGRMIANVAPTEANVLVLGEMGSGKELVAREIHAKSRRAKQIFLPVDLGALSETTLESELFGHKRGSFTDARSERAGRFQAAQGGTLFLDEVANMPLASQTKLLTVLERREVTPLGADHGQPIDVRIVSATNLDERALFDARRFRSDLLYRLNTIVLRVPPLRERREDVPMLVRHYLNFYARQYHKQQRPISDSAITALQTHGWSGNVRELRQACERAAILAQGQKLEASDFGLGESNCEALDLGAEVTRISATSPAANAQHTKLVELERHAVDDAVRKSNGNISQAAKLLGLSRAALYRRMEKHGL